MALLVDKMATLRERDSIPHMHEEITGNVTILINSLHEHHKHNLSQRTVSCSIYKRLTVMDTFHLTLLSVRDKFYVLFTVLFLISVGFDVRKRWISIVTVDQWHALFVSARLKWEGSWWAHFENTKGKCLSKKVSQSELKHVFGRFGMNWTDLVIDFLRISTLLIG